MKRIIKVVLVATIAGAAATAGCKRKPAVPSVVPAPTAPSAATAPAPPRTISMSPATTAPAKSSTGVRPTTAPSTAPSSSASLPPIAPNREAGLSKTAAFLGLIAPKPATWLWQPVQAERTMVVSEYVIPGKGDADQARLTIYKIGGTPEENINRWANERFRNHHGSPVEPTIEHFEADGLSITYAELTGEYRSMGAPSFTPDQTLLAAIVPDAPGGQAIIFFIGPTPTVQANRQSFLDMIKGIRKAEPEK